MKRLVIFTVKIFIVAQQFFNWDISIRVAVTYVIVFIENVPGKSRN